MKGAFADSLYWIAVARPNDPWRDAVLEARRQLGDILLVTTDEVLVEFVTALSRGGPSVRLVAVAMVRAILSDESVKVLPQSRAGFESGLERYGNRQDKQYSLTDCISMNTMDSEGITAVLTNDHHFEQEGYVVLIRRQ